MLERSSWGVREENENVTFTKTSIKEKEKAYGDNIYEKERKKIIKSGKENEGEDMKERECAETKKDT